MMRQTTKITRYISNLNFLQLIKLILKIETFVYHISKKVIVLVMRRSMKYRNIQQLFTINIKQKHDSLVQNNIHFSQFRY